MQQKNTSTTLLIPDVLYRVSNLQYQRQFFDGFFPNIQDHAIQDHTQPRQLSAYAQLSFASGLYGSTCPTFGLCENISIQIHDVPSRITNSETQSEESISVGWIGLEANNSYGKAEDPPDSTTTSADDEDDPCIVCMERPADAILLECGHGGLCVTCSTVLWSHSRHCPLCRQEFAAIMRIVARETRRTVRALCANKHSRIRRRRT